MEIRGSEVYTLHLAMYYFDFRVVVNNASVKCKPLTPYSSESAKMIRSL